MYDIEQSTATFLYAYISPLRINGLLVIVVMSLKPTQQLLKAFLLYQNSFL